MSKVIILDWGIYIHRSIFGLANNPSVPATYTCLSMIIGNLKRIGAKPEDIIIVAMDARGSWRKQFETSYKGDRAKKRSDSDIDFPDQYRQFDELVVKLKRATNWKFIKIDHLEADDIMIVCCRYFKDQEVVLATYDSDLEAGWHYPNVKIFSPKSKSYKLPPKNFNVYKLIAKKIKKETSDNLVNPILNKEDYDNRLKCINLIELPSWVEDAVVLELDNLEEDKQTLDYFPFKTLSERMQNLYNCPKSLVTYESCLKKEAKKLAKKKLKPKKVVKK